MRKSHMVPLSMHSILHLSRSRNYEEGMKLFDSILEIKSEQLPELWNLFSREAEIAALSIYDGLNYQLRAGAYYKGYFSKSLFNYGLGLERIIKLIIVINHMLENNKKAPTNGFLKSEVGHDLKKGYDLSVAISKRINSPSSNELNLIYGCEIKRTLFEILNEFWNKYKYYNLDKLTGDLNIFDPIQAWTNDLIVKISNKHPSKRINSLVDSLKGYKDPFTNIAYMGELEKHNQKHVTVYMAEIARAFVRLLVELQEMAHIMNIEIPYISEFFTMLLHNDKKSMLNKRKWSMYF